MSADKLFKVSFRGTKVVFVRASNEREAIETSIIDLDPAWYKKIEVQKMCNWSEILKPHRDEEGE